MTIKLQEDAHGQGGDMPSGRLTLVVSGLTGGEYAQPMSLRVFRAQAEARAISRALDFAGWNRRRAAKLLRISYRGLLYKIRQYKIIARPRDGAGVGLNRQPGAEK